MSAVAVPLNPFADQIVTSPRHAEPSVKGLNDQVLRRLLAEFEKVDAPPRHCDRVQLVVSPAGGYGKSHLTGRLFKELGRRATRVYVRPFSDPESCWVALLHTLVQELTVPEFEDGTDRGPFPPTQLDALAHGVFGTLLIGLMDAGEFTYNDPSFVRERLTKRTFEKWDLSNPQSAWGIWAAETLDSFEKSDTRAPRLIRMFEKLIQHTLSNTTRPQAWLRVLRSYAQDRADGTARDLALEWMRARTPRVAEATEPIGLVVSDGEDQSVGYAARNACARSRVLDFMALAKIFRPFVLCFDQTEVFGRVPGLARAFGSVLSDLVQGEGAHLTIVTANNDVWESELLPQMERADQDRIAPRVEMLGLTRDQGRELALQRLKETRLPGDLQDKVLATDWLDSQFSVGLLSPREFLRRCERRYEELVPAASAQPPRPEMMLVELYARERKMLLEEPRELSEYRGDVLRWALLDVPSRVDTGVTVAPCRNELPACVAEWKGGDAQRWLIVLEDGSHALNWRSTTARAVALHRENAKTVALAIRITGQPEIPQSGWNMVGPEIEEAQKKGALRIVTLTLEDVASVYAAWEIYTQACQGDIPHEPDSVVRFAAQRLHAWHASLRGAKTVGQMQDVAATNEIPTPLSDISANEMPVAPAKPVPPGPPVAVAPATPAKPVPPGPPVAVAPATPAKPVPPGPPVAVAPATPAKPVPPGPPVAVAPATPAKPVPPGPPAAVAPAAPVKSVPPGPPDVVASAAPAKPAPPGPPATVASVAAARPVPPGPPAVVAPAAPAKIDDGNGSDLGIGDLMREIISNRRFASYAEIAGELQTMAGREVPLKEAASAAESTGEIRVYPQGANAGFLWQGW